MGKILITVALLALSANIAFYYNQADENQAADPVQQVCDQAGYLYANEAEAKLVGLVEDQYSASNCDQGKHNPSWDINQDGANDCKEQGACEVAVGDAAPRNEPI